MQLSDLPWQDFGNGDRVADVQMRDSTWLHVVLWGRDNEYWVCHYRNRGAGGCYALITEYARGSKPDGLDQLEAQCAIYHIITLTQGGNDGPP